MTRTLPIAETLRVERARRRLSLREVSALARAHAKKHDLSTRGLSPTALSRIESGDTDPETSTLYALAGALEISPSVLVPDLPDHQE